MMNVLKHLKALFANLFTKAKKVNQIPQGEEYENWLGV
jgi:hypothetical protein